MGGAASRIARLIGYDGGMLLAISGFVFVVFLIFFVSAWFPSWSAKWANPNWPRNGYPMSSAGRIAFGACGMLFALCAATYDYQSRIIRVVALSVVAVLFVFAMYFAIRDKAEFDRKNSQN